MNGFQVIGVSIAATFALVAVSGILRRRITILGGLFWLTVWTAAAVAILNPAWTLIIARALGIARGADLVFYCAILAMFVGFFLTFAKLRRLERTLTLVVRETAISEGLERDSRHRSTSPTSPSRELVDTEPPSRTAREKASKPDAH